jgi:diamine N-acetyltransferase
MTVTLRDIDRNNFNQCVKLDVRDDQKNFVATNVYSIAQSKVEPTCTTQAIYDGDEMVGFIMYGLDMDDKRYWVGRLMIDQRHQGKGYGRAAMVEAIERMRREPDCREIILSINSANEVARKLYQTLGFRETGELNHGEEVMCLKLEESE